MDYATTKPNAGKKTFSKNKNFFSSYFHKMEPKTIDFYRFRFILLKFPKLSIVWTAGKNLVSPDTLSGNTSLELTTRNQL